MEHFFAILDTEHLDKVPSIAEDLVELSYQIGKWLFERGKVDTACIWLERGAQILQSQNLDRLSSDSSELRLSLLHTYGSFNKSGKAIGLAQLIDTQLKPCEKNLLPSPGQQLRRSSDCC